MRTEDDLNMKVNVLESDKGKLRIELDDLTFANLINDAIWDQKPDAAGYAKEHPYLSDPVLVVRAKNPKAIVTAAGQQVAGQIAALRKQLSKK